MADMLVRLFNLPSPYPLIAQMEGQGIVIRKPIGPENYAVIDWIRNHFEPGWASEAENAFFRDPKSIYIAVEQKTGEKPRMLGFACYDATVKGFFGPTGVDEAARGRGIGKALLMVCLEQMKQEGYGYCVIGDPGPTEFYEKVCGATVIEDSVPGVYGGMVMPG